MDTRRRSPLRLVAPIAIVAAAVALVLVISSSGNSGGGDSGGASASEKAKDLGTTTSSSTRKKKSHSSKRDKLPQDVYVVKRGDTLGAIATRTGVPVERLQELNPGLDQFSLVAGQRIKLR